MIDETCSVQQRGVDISGLKKIIVAKNFLVRRAGG